MLLGDPHVEEALRIALGKLFQSRAAGHRRRDRRQPWHILRQLNQRVAEHRRVGRRRSGVLIHGARRRVKLADAVELVRLHFRRQIPAALFRPHMDKNRAVQHAGLREHVAHQPDIVAVDGPDISEAHFLKEAARHQYGLDALLDVFRRLDHRIADMGDAAKEILDVLLRAIVLRRDPDARQIFAHGAHVGGNTHAVVVQDDDQVRPQIARMVQRLERLAARHRAVADDRDDMIAAPLDVAGDRHAQRRRDGSAGMADAERVVLRLRP